MQQQWMYKFIYFEFNRGDWFVRMVDSMPTREGDEDSEFPMPDYVDILAGRGWEMVTAIRVDDPEPDLLLLIFKRPRD